MSRKSAGALPTTDAAEVSGMTPASFRSAMARARRDGIDCRLPESRWPDKRTPLWDARKLRRYLDTRPGRGNWKKA